MNMSRFGSRIDILIGGIKFAIFDVKAITIAQFVNKLL